MATVAAARHPSSSRHQHLRSGSHEAERTGAMNLTHRRGTMKKNLDFSKARRNPYATRLKKQVTIRLDDRTISYFKSISKVCGIPYQTLMNLYLRDCAARGTRLEMNWKSPT